MFVICTSRFVSLYSSFNIFAFCTSGLFFSFCFWVSFLGFGLQRLCLHFRHAFVLCVLHFGATVGSTLGNLEAEIVSSYVGGTGKELRTLLVLLHFTRLHTFSSRGNKDVNKTLEYIACCYSFNSFLSIRVIEC